MIQNHNLELNTNQYNAFKLLRQHLNKDEIILVETQITKEYFNNL